MWCEGVCSVKILCKVWAMSEMSNGFPAVMARIIALPMYQILILVAVLTAIQDAFNFVFGFIINYYRRWGRWVSAVYIITVVRVLTEHSKGG